MLSVYLKSNKHIPRVDNTLSHAFSSVSLYPCILYKAFSFLSCSPQGLIPTFSHRDLVVVWAPAALLQTRLVVMRSQADCVGWVCEQMHVCKDPVLSCRTPEWWRGNVGRLIHSQPLCFCECIKSQCIDPGQI